VGHRAGLDHQVGDTGGGHGRVQSAGGAQRTQLVAQFAALVTDQPGSQRPGRLSAGAAVEHDLAAAVADQQPGRRVAGGVYRPDPEQGEPQPRRHRRHAGARAARGGPVSQRS